MKAAEIRKRFLDFFEKNDHTVVKSSPLIPKDDPTLLFTNAGMVQFKNIFLGQEKRDYCRATTSQKCLRVGGKHNDLENVGRTARHHTFFEMLGNFSFGDYFKPEAIRLAWEFITEELKLPKEKLYITIYNDDDEAEELWKKIADIPADRLYRLGDKDNFWSMGDTGPCGPCSEIHIDQGEDMSCGPNCGIGKCDCDRYLEIWNLVFMQYDQGEDGVKVPLPRPSIDTGMGLERIAAVCQGVQSNYETDLFQAIIGYVAGKAGVKYRENPETDTALQVIADHSRAIAFMITDQIMPSNEGRGYVLRRLIRRAFRFGRFIGFDAPFLHDSIQEVIRQMGEAFPELHDNKDFMVRVVKEEEERFGQTLDKGLAHLEEAIADLKKSGKKILTGEVAFKLYDTYGFPIDIVNDICEKQGLSVDEPRFKECMQEQKDRAKKAWKGSGEKDVATTFKPLLEAGVRSTFTGYDTLEEVTSVKSILDEDGNIVKRLIQGQGGWIVTDSTPFYGESGGQAGDLGTLETTTGSGDVLDTVKPSQNLTAHKVFINEGEILPEQETTLAVSDETRIATARNHTCTHLLHSALRKVLGDHVNQSGSLVGPNRLRFDFTHISAMTVEEIADVEMEVNRAILANETVATDVLSYDDAVEKGATALFGEKYEDDVRVVTMGDVSMELCGGTHLPTTGQAGSFVITSEGGVAAGIRRIEAATGFNALHYFTTRSNELSKAASMLKAKPAKVAEKIKGLQTQVKELTREAEKLQSKLASSAGGDLVSSAEEIGGVKVIAAKVDIPNVKVLREQVDTLKSKLDSGVICLIADVDGKVSVIISVTKDLHDKYTASTLIKPVAGEVGGGGGGRPDMAQAGGTNPSGIDNALAKLKELVGA
ncbi:MAG: alanine--tRNA ligase [Desulfovibrio sp.]